MAIVITYISGIATVITCYNYYISNNGFTMRIPMVGLRQCWWPKWSRCYNSWYLICIYIYVYIYIYICIYKFVPGPGTTCDGVGGWGGMLRFMWTCRSSWCYAHAGWGGVGMGWDVNVHVNLQKQLIVRTRGVGWGGMGWDVNVHVNLQMMMIVMLMMMMTMMMMMWCWWWWCDDDDDDDPNETCQFRDEISSRNWQVLPT